MHPKVESGKSRSVNLNLCARMPLPTKCVADVSQAVSTGQLDRAVPAHALAGHRISWHGRPCRVPPGRGVSSYDAGVTDKHSLSVFIKTRRSMKAIQHQFHEPFSIMALRGLGQSPPSLYSITTF